MEERGGKEKKEKRRKKREMILSDRKLEFPVIMGLVGEVSRRRRTLYLVSLHLASDPADVW